MKLSQINPISIAWARQNCTGIEIHCLRCSWVAKTDWNRFEGNESLIDLPRRHRFVCGRCGNRNPEYIQARPVYPYRSERREYLGLEKNEGDSSKADGD